MMDDWRRIEIEGAISVVISAARVKKKVDMDAGADQSRIDKASDLLKQAVFHLVRKTNRWILYATKRRKLLREYKELVTNIFIFMEHDAVIRAHATQILNLKNMFELINAGVADLEEEEDGSRSN